MRLACLIFDDITVLDLLGPLEVLSRLPKAEIILFAPSMSPIITSISGVTLTPHTDIQNLEDVDVLLIPGGFGVRPLVKDKTLLARLAALHQTTRYTTSVCTGSLLLAAAGLLQGLEATTHWNSREQLEQFGARYTERRVVEHERLITAAGVSAGIDMALLLAARLTNEEIAKTIQLSIEYDPEPPFDAGSPAKAGPDIVANVQIAVHSLNK
ncbi:MAG: DJ-1/PfpI family protein [Parvularculales bacterium]